MSYFPLTSTAKTLNLQSSQANMLTTGLGISAPAVSILDDASTDAILSTLGGGSTGINIFKDTTAAAVRAEIGAGPAYVVEAKTADFTAESGKFYEVDTTSGAVAVTMFTIASGADFVGFKKVAGSNDITINRNGTQDIDDATSKVLSAINEAIDMIPKASGNEWMIK